MGTGAALARRIVTAFLDTSVAIRYLTDDQPELAERAARIIDGGDELLVTPAMIAETGYVLTSVYKLARDVVVDALVRFIRRDNITPYEVDKALAIQGLLLCRPSRRVSFADAMIWAAARSSHVGAVYSFDERFPTDGLTIYRDPGVDPPGAR